jgi:diacylglycerol O-acyltransferase
MPHHREDNRLSSGDALFLYLEREGMPLNVASVSVFEGAISLQACMRFIESKLPSIPRYRQRVVAPPYGLGLPAWEYDPDFDIRNHVHHLTLKQGTDTELKTVAGAILSKMLDRRLPLWDFTLIHGLKGNCTGVVTRMHHSLADGLAGVSLMNALMDSSPEVRPLPKGRARFTVAPPNSTPSLVDELINSSASLAERVLTAQMELFQVFRQVLAAASGEAHEAASVPQAGNHSEIHIPSVDEFARLMPELSTATQLLPFNIICRGPQKFRWAEIPFADIKSVKQACGATVNEVALTLITSTFQRYAELRGVRLRGRLLRIVVPVSVRGNGNANDLGNRITFVPLVIPLDIRSPRSLLTAIRKRTAFLKSTHIAECVGLFGTILGTIPTAAQQIVGPIVSQVPLGLCNLIFTNVPGPTSPLYLLGHKMLRCYPYVPIGGDMGINSAMLTYNGTAYFGFTGDTHAAPDLGRLEKLLITSFAELRRALGSRQPRSRRAPPKVKTAYTPETKQNELPTLPAVLIPTNSGPTTIVAGLNESGLLARISA